MEKAKKKNKPWLRARHGLVTKIAGALLHPYSKFKYGIEIEKFKGDKKRPYLILYNHQTAFDQFFVGISFGKAIYYLATEDIFSLGWLSSLLRFLVAPIPIKKQTMDIRAIKNCLQIAKEGGSISLAPEGNRTYSGKTEYMSPTIAPLARKLGLPIALYRIEGGYGTQPRWSDVIRKGKMRAYVSRVIEPEEYALLSDDELFAKIREELYVNEANISGRFLHSRLAEYIERLLYVCPYCGLSVFESQGAHFRCTACNREIAYEESKELRGIDFDLPFRFVNDWYEYQKDFVSQLDLSKYEASPMFCDEIRLSQVIISKKKKLLRKSASLRLYGDRVTIDEGTNDPLRLPFDELYAVAVLGRNKLNLYHKDHVYQVKGSRRFNAIKYVNIYYHHKNIKQGENNGKFLGL